MGKPNENGIDLYPRNLATYSSSDHRLYQKEIQGYLEDIYRVEVSRRTLQTHINELKEEGYIDGYRGVYLIENKFKESTYR